MTGIQNYYGNVVSMSKAALMLEDLRAFARHLDCRYFEHARDWCACLLAFFGLLRVGEYMGGGLRRGDVKIAADCVSITIMRSKTSNVPVVVSVAARSDSLCPARALLDYLAFFPLLRLPQDDGCPLFLSRLRNNRPVIEPMTEADFIANLRLLVRVARRCLAATRGATPATPCAAAVRRHWFWPACPQRTSSNTAAGGRTPTSGTSSTRSARQFVSSLLAPSCPHRRLVLSEPVPSFLPHLLVLFSVGSTSTALSRLASLLLIYPD